MDMMRVSKTLFNMAKSNAVKRYGDEGLKHAWHKTVQTAAADAAVQGGLAAIQGNDPWEAAKSGLAQGAFLGAGYQSLRFATNANKSTFKGNLKHMARAANVGVSKQVRAIHRQKQTTDIARNVFGHKK